MKLLDEHGAMYGYEITKAVRESSAGKLNITEGALYPALHRLEAAGVVVTESRKVDGRIRKYYLLTTHGKQKADEEISAFRDALETLKGILLPKKVAHG